MEVIDQSSSTAANTIEADERIFGENDQRQTMKLMPRKKWGAEDPKQTLDTFGGSRAEYIIISQVLMTEPCTDTAECCAKMRLIQQLHKNDRGFDDIAFNYVIANDGIVYEGRGIDNIPATAKGWNVVSYGIAFMGQYDNELSKVAIASAQILFRFLCCKQKLINEYTVYGLRQVRPYAAPSDELYNEIKTWDRWQPYGEDDQGESSEEIAAAAAVVAETATPENKAN